MRLPFQAASPAPARAQPQPTQMPKLPNATVAAIYRGSRAGGDFFDFLLSPSGRLVFLLLDVAGDRSQAFGIAAAAQQSFRALASGLFTDAETNESVALTELLLDMNRAIMAAAGGVRCAPAFLAAFDPALGTLWYANAGHTPALLRDGDDVTELEASGLPLGLFSHATHDAQLAVLPPKAALVLVSKGLVEARSSGSDEFGMGGVRAAVQAFRGGTAEAVCNAVLEANDLFLAAQPESRFFVARQKRGARNDRTVLAVVRG